MIHFLNGKASAEQIEEMLEALEVYIKLAVDICERTIAGGGTLHADCEAVLLENGSTQENIWGADWLPHSRQVTYESLINIRPKQKNFSLEIQDLELRNKIEEIVGEVFDE